MSDFISIAYLALTMITGLLVVAQLLFGEDHD